MRTVEWDDSQCGVRLIDQRLLPGEFKTMICQNYHQVADAIRQMVVRGAPAIGVTAAFGLAQAAYQSEAYDRDGLLSDLREAAGVLRNARPTAVNLAWALERVIGAIEKHPGDIDDLRKATLDVALRMADEDVEINRRMAQYGASLIADGDIIIHHCNTGALAAVDWGTALGVIRMAHEQGKRMHILVDETRPRLQGARLTAWELSQIGIPYEIITDNAAGYFLHAHQVNKVFFGGDRMAANGDVANKIGTYMLALAAYDNDVPAYSVVPTSTVDLSLAHGDLIPIEERNQDEVLHIQFEGQVVVPLGAKARNPAFDVTPSRLLAAIVTENGIVYPPYDINLPRLVSQSSGLSL